ncbi:MAG: 3'(2'),5'-bisphosphate nucleotidase CysQ [Bacteroidetes bacterium]|nr:3'(2'),5'-bisphosphate nucleotidase CysQ [Bacteroidota bacterium]
MDYTALLKLAITASLEAGEEILKIYNTDFNVEIKPDNTPVTNADKAANNSIIKNLAITSIKVLSEEDEQFSYAQRKTWKQIWIVDPLDGTKEFVKRNGEFTVNIALVEDQQPQIGVIYSPVFKYLYFALKGMGSFKVNEHDVLSFINQNNTDSEILIKLAKKLPLVNLPEAYTIVASRSHLSKEVSARISDAKLRNSKVEIINTGSSIKFCRLAEGLAHEYPRFGTTMEWDTAAGQIIIEEAGGKVIDQSTGAPIVYNREDLKNNNFIAFSGLVKQ